MASKYSNYELKPYVSTYANPYSVEVNEVLRKRYDDNKASVDLIDKTLGSKQVLEGDRVHVEKAKGLVEEKFGKVTELGDYENATLVVDEVMVDLESNKGLQYAQQSYANRENELKYIQEATLQGLNMLDFGQFKSGSHQSYVQDEETGAWSKNIYQPLSEKEHSYDASIRGLIGNIRADASGISQGKANRIAKNLLPGYLDSFVGDQHLRKLTQIEGMSEGEARATILDQIESFTDQQVHYTASQSVKQSGGVSPYMMSYKPSLSNIGNPLNLKTTKDIENLDLSVLAQAEYVFNHNTENSTKQQINDKNRILNHRVSLIKGEFNTAVSTGKVTEEERGTFKKNMMDPYRGNGTLQQFILYQTQPGSVTEGMTEWSGAGPIDHWGAGATSLGIAGSTWLGAGLYQTIKQGAVTKGSPFYKRFVSGMKGKTAAKMALVLFGMDELIQYTDKVTDPMNNQSGSIFRNLNSEGTFGADSRMEVFESNMRKTHVLYNKGIMDTRPGMWQGEEGNQKFVYDLEGEPCNCPFKNGDPFWEQQIKNGKNSMLYMAEGGGSTIFETIEDLGPVEQDVDVFVPSGNKEGIAAHKLNNAGLDNMHITDFNWMGFSEESSPYKDFFMDKDHEFYKDMKFLGIQPGSIDEEHGARVIISLGKDGDYGNKSKATPKDTKGMSFVETAFMNQGRPDQAAEASSFELLQRMEFSNSGDRSYSQSGGITRWDHLDVLSKNLFRIHQEFLTPEMLSKKDIYGNVQAPLTYEGAVDMAHGIIQQRLIQNNREVFKSIDQAYTDPTENMRIKQKVFDYLYSQEFLRDDINIPLDQIVNN